MKGIILAGGTGSRLYPLTLVTSKQLLPVFDKPMIYYPLSLLMMANIKEVLIISTPHDLPNFEKLLGDGSFLGMSFSYAAQEKPRGIAEAFLVAEEFLEKEPCALILGDNIFYGYNMRALMQNQETFQCGARVFGYEVKDPCRYGVIDFDEQNRVIDIIEKPKSAPSNYAVTGLYFYDQDVVSIAKTLKPSARGELEITDVNKAYLEKKQLNVELLPRGFAWLDTGTHDALQKASSFVQTLQERQGVQVACIEEIAFENGWISLEKLKVTALQYQNSDYGKHLISFAKSACSLEKALT